MNIPTNMPRLKGFRYPREVIAYAVWAYHRLALSTADVEDLLAARGVIVSRETVRLWVNRFGPHFADCIRRDRPRPNDKWHMDEVVISICGKKHWLWRNRRQRRRTRHSCSNTPECQSGKALFPKISCPVWRTQGHHHGQIAQLHQTDQDTGPGCRPPRPQRLKQRDRSVAPADPQTRENNGPVQIPPPGSEVSIRA